MIFDWVIGFFVVAIALGLLGVVAGFVRGLLPVRPYPDQRRIAALEYELFDEGSPPGHSMAIIDNVLKDAWRG